MTTTRKDLQEALSESLVRWMRRNDPHREMTCMNCGRSDREHDPQTWKCLFGPGKFYIE